MERFGWESRKMREHFWRWFAAAAAAAGRVVCERRADCLLLLLGGIDGGTEGEGRAPCVSSIDVPSFNTSVARLREVGKGRERSDDDDTGSQCRQVVTVAAVGARPGYYCTAGV